MANDVDIWEVLICLFILIAGCAVLLKFAIHAFKWAVR